MSGRRIKTLIARRLIAAISIFAMLSVQTVALAQSTTATPHALQREAADSGAALANSIRPTTAPATVSGNTVVFGPAGSAYEVPLNEFFPDHDTTSGSSGVALYGQETGLQSSAASRIDTLEAGNDAQSRAWQTFATTAAQTPPEVNLSDMFSVSEDVLDAVDTYGQCTVQETFEPFPRIVSTYEERTCNRRSSEFQSCTVDHLVDYVFDTHTINIPVSDFVERIDIDVDTGVAAVRTVSLSSCKPFQNPACISTQTKNTQTVHVAPLTLARLCGSERTGTPSSVHSNIGPNGSFNCSPGATITIGPRTVASYCSTSTHCSAWGGLQGYAFGQQNYSCETTVTGSGDDQVHTTTCYPPAISNTFRYSLNYHRVSQDIWTPQACVDRIEAARGGSCGVNLVSTPPGPKPCINTSIGAICPSHPAWSLISPPPFDPTESQVSRGARQVEMTAPSCGTQTAQTCWVTNDGTYTCETLSTDDPLNNSCQELLNTPQCTYSRSEVLFDPEDPTLSTVYEDVYLCREDAEVVDTKLVRQAVCNATIPGVGEDLVSQPRESSSSFGKAAAYLSATRMIAQDTACEDPTDPGTCSIFGGKPAKCKVAVFGYVDCCESPGGIGLGDYIALILALGEVDSAVRGLDATNVVRTSYEALVDPVTLPFEEAYAAVSEGLANNVNTIFGTTLIDTAEAASTGLISSVQQSLMRQAAEWTAEIFGDAAANALFEVVPTVGAEAGTAVVGGVVQEGAIQLAAQVASILSVISIVYSIYSIAKLLVQIIWACEEHELQLAVQRDLKSAHYVGPYCSQKVLFACLEKQKSYCTFSAPLSRIVQQQARPQLGLSWGTPEAPECRGLTVDELSTLDWEQIDLGEWESIILTSGAIPDAASMNIDALTGSGHTLANPVSNATGQPRQNVIERTFGRTDAIDFEDARTRAGSSLRARGLP